MLEKKLTRTRAECGGMDIQCKLTFQHHEKNVLDILARYTIMHTLLLDTQSCTSLRLPVYHLKSHGLMIINTVMFSAFSFGYD